jgi:MMP 1-O-methyltransferase
MAVPLMTRVRLKLQKIKRDLDPLERKFRQFWPLIDPVEGWLVPEEGKWLFAMARSLPEDSNIVEVGSYKGRSTCCLGFGALTKHTRVFAIDTFDGGPGLPKAYTFADFTQNIKRRGLSKTVEPIVGMSGEVSKTWNRPIHLLFIDASHAYEDVLTDFAGFFPHVVAGGVVAFHDTYNSDWPGVLRAWNEVIKVQLAAIKRCGTLAYGRKPR